MVKKSVSLGVDWVLPTKKRRFATTTKATNDLIVLLSEDGHTVSSAYDEINYDSDAKEVLKVFMDHGYGEFLLNDLVG